MEKIDRFAVFMQFSDEFEKKAGRHGEASLLGISCFFPGGPVLSEQCPVAMAA